MLTDLKPCPFCGAQPESPDVGDYFVECPSCGVQGPISNKDGQPHAKEEWNCRPIKTEVLQANSVDGITAFNPLNAASNHGASPPPPCPETESAVRYLKAVQQMDAAEIAELKAKVARLESELADALDVKNGTGPTALSMVMADRDALQAKVAELEHMHADIVEIANVSMNTAKKQSALIEQVRNALLWKDERSGHNAALAAIAAHKKGWAK